MVIYNADGSRAEYAGAIRSDLKGRGFGRLLLEEIIDYCRQHVAAYKAPRQVYFIDAMPLGPSGQSSVGPVSLLPRAHWI